MKKVIDAVLMQSKLDRYQETMSSMSHFLQAPPAGAASLQASTAMEHQKEMEVRTLETNSFHWSIILLRNFSPILCFLLLNVMDNSLALWCL